MQNDAVPTEPLIVTHRSTVTNEQIDHLGHMNVRFYGVNAQAGSQALAARLGIGETDDTSIPDTYTRHHREQLVGADLEVRSGVVSADPHALRLYHELRNPERDEIAATFVHRLVAGDRPFPDEVVAAATALTIEIPEHGRTRSLDLDADPAASAPDLNELVSRDLAMRQPREVSADECDDAGNYIVAMAPMLTWGGEPLKGQMGPMLHDGPDGERMGWASMETRMVLARMPTRGDRIQAFGANLALGDKVSHRIQWAYDLDRRDLLCSFEVINLAFDTVGRRAMSIPPDIREQHERDFHPDLAPRQR